MTTTLASHRRVKMLQLLTSASDPIGNFQQWADVGLVRTELKAQCFVPALVPAVVGQFDRFRMLIVGSSRKIGYRASMAPLTSKSPGKQLVSKTSVQGVKSVEGVETEGNLVAERMPPWVGI